MIPKDKEPSFEQVIYAMLVSPERTLTAYARLTGYPIERFYSSADLTGVTLTLDEYEALNLAHLDVDLTGARILRTEEEQDTAERFEQIAMELFASVSFAQTHAVVARLIVGFPFSLKAAEIFLIAARNNNQVGWILGDGDLLEVMHLLSISPEVMADKKIFAQICSMLDEARSRRP